MAIVNKKVYDSFSSEDISIPIPEYKNVEDIYRKAKLFYVKTLPFDIEKFIKSHNVNIVREEMDDDISGYIELRNNSWVIGLNQYQNPRRQRFTLAHEFAHFLFDSKEIQNTKSRKITDKILFRKNESDITETRANDFAGKILMPKNIFQQLLTEGIRDISELSERFNVSIAALRYRAYKLGYIKKY